MNAVIGPFPEVEYAPSGDVSVAYEVVGGGPVDVVFALGLCGNVELSREVPFLRRWLERLAGLGRVVHYDRRGTGLSDRDLDRGSAEERMDDIRAVMDAAEMKRAVLVATLDGGPAALMFAATYPERVSHLVLYETWARVKPAADYEIGIDPKAAGSLDEAIAAAWGSGRVLQAVVGDRPPDDRVRQQLARLERGTASPRVAREHARLAGEVDVRSALSTVQAPSLVMWRDGLARYRPLCQWLGANLQGALARELPGSTLHSWQARYEDEVLDEVEGFLGGQQQSFATDEDRVMTTILFTDIVDSTRRASDLGDIEWKRLLARHDEVVRDLLHRYRGREVKTTGDGFLASFDGPARAVRCARAITQDVKPLGIEVRAGLHAGECIRHGDDLAGVAVHIAARICNLAGANEVLTTGTVRDLVIGSDLTFNDRGQYLLKGITGEWPVVALS
jgi:class 3 adenylate cyclase